MAEEKITKDVLIACIGQTINLYEQHKYNDEEALSEIIYNFTNYTGEWEKCGLKRPGDKILVKEHKILGTPEAEATVISVEEYGYIVHITGDDVGWNGPVDVEGNVLCEELLFELFD